MKCRGDQNGVDPASLEPPKIVQAPHATAAGKLHLGMTFSKRLETGECSHPRVGANSSDVKQQNPPGAGIDGSLRDLDGIVAIPGTERNAIAQVETEDDPILIADCT